MRRMMRALCGFLSNPYTQFGIGVMIVTAGGVELYEEFQAGNSILHPAHGITMLGMLLTLIAVEHIILGHELVVGAVASRDVSCSSRLVKMAHAIKSLLDSAWFQVGFGALLIASGLGSAYEDIVHPSAALVNNEGLWYIGVILIGANVFVHGFSGFAFGLKRIHTVGKERNWRFRTLLRLNMLARNPRVELVLACLLIGLGLLEHVAFSAIDGEQTLQAHHGMALYGVSILARLGTSVFFGLELAEDSYEQVAERQRKV